MMGVQRHRCCRKVLLCITGDFTVFFKIVLVIFSFTFNMSVFYSYITKHLITSPQVYVLLFSVLVKLFSKMLRATLSSCSLPCVE